jgi:fucose permease
LGIGASAADTVLNDFVALHYKSKHMNYLHSFWGVGATAGPLIMAMYIGQAGGLRVLNVDCVRNEYEQI